MHNRLTVRQVKVLRDPGTYSDGGGLNLIVEPTGSKRWLMRMTVSGRRVNRGLGGYPTVDLEEARRKAAELREAAKRGQPVKTGASLPAGRVKFEEAFHDMFRVRARKLKNPKHIQQWQNTMRDYVFPTIGARPVADIDASEIIATLEPIWWTKPETGKRVLQRIEATMKSAILRGYRDKASPCIGVAQELGTEHRVEAHYAALPYAAVPGFVAQLHERPTIRRTRLGFEWLILTACRSGEMRMATWQEIDRDVGTWTIPVERLKARKAKHGPHVVPLSDRCLEILEEAEALRVSDYIFAGTQGQPLSDNTFSKLMRDGKIPGTPHGFRSCFKDWAAENGIRDEVSETALAHVDANSVRAAYRRTMFLDERRLIMQQWADFVTSKATT